MGTRVELDNQIREIQGIHNVYFQPPESYKMKYPCLVYDLDNEHALHADNRIYRRKRRYTLTWIDYDPDCEVPDLIGEVFNARMDRHFENDGLHHFVYIIYF